jgi:CDP-diacylglycerol--serine O-phosphatidyltransferase
MTAGKPADNPRSMLWFALDPPNLVSLAGLLSAALAIYFAILGNFPAAMIGLVWAVAFDWSDGRVARGMKGRTEEQREFGAHLDSLIDVVSFGVAPAVVLLSLGGFRPWFLPGAVVVLAAGVIRLSYFNVFGLADGSTYRGLALDNNVIIMVFLFAFQRMFSEPVFGVVVYVALMMLAVLNVAPIRTPKFGGRWYYVMIAYAVGVSAFYGWQLLVSAG